ncbi:Hypothetical predicted protein [Mytilus galloprovincialis]|uniref:Uncharacterized protein n=1 Tax=Mytilus galloprovincialis TaxID=29158 RepID=A0A8B6GWJ7_MYTGA|nr:Hypothetical predicted protein [Mytilus galloprovincialis]
MLQEKVLNIVTGEESKTRKTSETSAIDLTPKASPKISKSNLFTNDLTKLYDNDLNNNLYNKQSERKGSLFNKFGQSIISKNQQSKGRRSASPKNQLLTANQQEGYSPFGRVHSPMRLSPGHLPASHWQPTIIDLGTF